MASIRKRIWRTAAGEERQAWVADYFDQQGKRCLKTFKTKKGADAWLVQARGEIARGIHTPDSTSITVAEAAELWIQRCEANRLERSTIEGYRSHLKHHILPVLGREKLSRLNVATIETFADRLLKDRSRAMARKILGSLKALLKDARRRGKVAQNVAAGVTIDSSQEDRHEVELEVGLGIPEKHEIRALLETAPAPRWRAFFTTAAFTGLRASELRGLAWSNVDFEAKRIRVRQRADRWGTIGSPKSKGSRRDIPMSPMVVNVLREWKLACPRGDLGLVFPNGTGKVELYPNIRRAVGPIMVEAGLVDGAGRPKYGLHALRHFFASWLIDQGFNPKRVQKLMGHATLAMTMDTYAKVFPDDDDHELFAAGELAVLG